MSKSPFKVIFKRNFCSCHLNKRSLKFFLRTSINFKENRIKCLNNWLSRYDRSLPRITNDRKFFVLDGLKGSNINLARLLACLVINLCFIQIFSQLPFFSFWSPRFWLHCKYRCLCYDDKKLRAKDLRNYSVFYAEAAKMKVCKSFETKTN